MTDDLCTNAYADVDVRVTSVAADAYVGVCADDDTVADAVARS